jgi:hypothetical protein
MACIPRFLAGLWWKWAQAQTVDMLDAGVFLATCSNKSRRVSVKRGANTYRVGNWPKGLSGFFDPAGAVEYPIPSTTTGTP